MKRLIFFLFTLLSFSVAYAQPGSLSQSVYRSRVNDSTTVVGSTASGYGYWYWNNQAATPHWDFYTDAGVQHVFSFGSGGGGGSNFWKTDANTAVTEDIVIDGSAAGKDLEMYFDSFVMSTATSGFGFDAAGADFTGDTGYTRLRSENGANDVLIETTPTNLLLDTDQDMTWRVIDDLIINGASGTTGQVIGNVNGVPQWENAASSGHTIEEEGTPLTARGKLNFVGPGVTVTDDSGDDASVVTIPQGDETTDGTFQVATTAEILTGTSDVTVVTPLKLNALLAKKAVTITADVPQTSATPIDITALSFPVVSGETYHFRFIINYTASATSIGSSWGINGPALTALSWQTTFVNTSSTVSVQNGFSTHTQSAATGTSTLVNVSIIEGFITPSASGSVIGRVGGEGGGTITVKAGSLVEYTHLTP